MMSLIHLLKHGHDASHRWQRGMTSTATQVLPRVFDVSGGGNGVEAEHGESPFQIRVCFISR